MMIVNVNPIFIFLRAVFILLVSASVLTACGQRGPLYLPGKPDAAVNSKNQTTTSTTTTTIPASR
jgi:predicted small lipoprotein YifL